MYCLNCGCEIKEKIKFCHNCGKPIEQSETTNEKTHNSEKPKKKKTPIKIVVSIIAVIAIIVGGFSLFNSSKKISYIEYTEEGITEFCETAIKNLDGGKAEILSIDGDLAKIIVKRDGYQEETIWVHFTNRNDTDKVYSIYFKCKSVSYSDNYYESCISLASAIEKTICGKREVNQYSDLEKVKSIMRSQPMIGGNEEIIAEYSLSSSTKSIISCKSQACFYSFIFIE